MPDVRPWNPEDNTEWMSRTRPGTRASEIVGSLMLGAGLYGILAAWIDPLDELWLPIAWVLSIAGCFVFFRVFHGQFSPSVEPTDDTISTRPGTSRLGSRFFGAMADAPIERPVRLEVNEREALD